MNTSRRTFIAGSAAFAFGSMAAAWGRPAFAADYPAEPVRLIVPYPPGAATDTLGRMAGQTYTQTLGQSFIVENRGGGGTTIGTRTLATSKPDGYTIGMVDSSFTINPGLLGDRLPYDTQKDFAPISLMATAPFVLVVHPSVPVQDLAGFIRLAKSKPGSLSYGSAGVGSGPHLAGEQLRQEANIDILHVPYRGGGTVFTDLLGGQIQFAFATVPSLRDHILAGRLRALAVTSDQRSTQLPDVPTFTEAGLPGVNLSPLFGLVAPAGVPVAVIDKLSSTVATSIQSGSMHKQLTDMGFNPVGSSPAEFAQRINTEIAKWRELIKRGGITVE
ncbi:Bug family tripartite tricarboxylate transporter substrate binding protein [Bordetella genomosp. 4]|uniref:Bug family tripartite tricarboxylate transporter substrate binding protein n=1 Tax=Bordetella genomosp. 4 TaxID=463044 RepID=UPI000B9E09AF|nr:tripartite tricarboxylate transporter substrate binding protein [Bordetella genomosp. 4]OZI45251.1 twin-arginine translocation pathway signal protein [Bordetella genomosp. 4]